MTVPLPLDEAGDTETHGAGLLAVQLQPDAVVTVMVPFPPAAVEETAVEEMVKAHAPA